MVCNPKRKNWNKAINKAISQPNKQGAMGEIQTWVGFNLLGVTQQTRIELWQEITERNMMSITRNLNKLKEGLLVIKLLGKRSALRDRKSTIKT